MAQFAALEPPGAAPRDGVPAGAPAKRLESEKAKTEANHSARDCILELEEKKRGRSSGRAAEAEAAEAAEAGR